MTLQVDQEVTELGPMTDYGFTTSKRAAKTIINAEDQQTVVIGGLMKDIVTEGDSKIPILGDIPVIGALFKYTKNKKEKVNLLIILTPHIVEGKEDFERIYKRKMEERDEFAKKFYGSIKDYERSVTLAKKRGALLAMAKLLDDDRRREEEEMERLRSRRGDKGILIGPGGEQKEIDLDRKTPPAVAPVEPGPASAPAEPPAREDTLVPPVEEAVPPLEEQP